ncbi:hypothetical protein BJ684DRAFT_21952 [Piptocephalis cylindrospora]|uniref:Uncharacterized protein n=1 Tax=Piptocephalis cylindrospora TaxID=1907219 RepID=A0A4P9XYK7_9FUNG|nr:hypothetical protein BJ684DRAFT_21952 [Piptocephalis cylindrospora]|eukprot:RKP11477.1 hypothetical protein BJ684DRAFT_21952 [Piptocephalis cylindrospora]
MDIVDPPHPPIANPLSGDPVQRIQYENIPTVRKRAKTKPTARKSAPGKQMPCRARGAVRSIPRRLQAQAHRAAIEENLRLQGRSPSFIASMSSGDEQIRMILDMDPCFDAPCGDMETDLPSTEEIIKQIEQADRADPGSIPSLFRRTPQARAAYLRRLLNNHEESRRASLVKSRTCDLRIVSVPSCITEASSPDTSSD